MDVRRFHPRRACSFYVPHMHRHNPNPAHPTSPLLPAPNHNSHNALPRPQNSYQALFSRFLGVLVIMAPTITLVVSYMALIFPHHLLTYLRASLKCSSSSPFRAYAWCSRKIPQNRNSSGEKWHSSSRCAHFHISNTHTQLHARRHLFRTLGFTVPC